MSASVSVLIVNYKVYEDLAACLDALSLATGDTIAEVVVVDQESDRARLADVVRPYSKVRTIPRADNIGFGAGINEAARHASAEYLLILNPDTILQPGALAILIAFMEGNRDVAAAGPKVVSPDGTLQRTARTFPTALTGLFGRTSLMTKVWPENPLSRHNLPGAADPREPIEVDWVAGACAIVRAQMFRAIGGFDEAFFLYWEDADLCRRLRDRGMRVMYVPMAVVVHAVARSSDRARLRSLVAFHSSALRYYGKHQRGPSRVVALPFAAAALGARLLMKLTTHFLRRGLPPS